MDFRHDRVKGLQLHSSWKVFYYLIIKNDLYRKKNKNKHNFQVALVQCKTNTAKLRIMMYNLCVSVAVYIKCK